MLFNQQRLPVHFGRLVNAQQVKQGRRNVSQFAVTQAFNLLRRIDQNIHDLTDGVSRIGRAGFFINHLFGITMIRRYQQNTANILNGLGNAAQTLVNRGNRLERGFHIMPVCPTMSPLAKLQMMTSKRLFSMASTNLSVTS